MKPSFFLVAALVCVAVPAFAVPVAVIVVGADNKPIAGVKLKVYEFDSAPESKDKTIDGVTLRADGTYAFEWDGNWENAADPDDEGRTLHLDVSAPGMTEQWIKLVQGRTTIVLLPLRAWSGLVLDQNQKPVAGAKLAVRSVNGFTKKGESRSATTDANGRWTLTEMPADGNAELAFIDSRFVTQRVNLEIGEGDATPIYARPGAAITGVLRAPDGTPVAGEKVTDKFWDSDNETVTDAQGRFTVTGLESGTTTLYVGDFFGRENEGKALPAFLFDRLNDVRAEAGQTNDLGEIKADKGVLISARVVDSKTKLPVSEARFFDNWGNSTSYVSDKEGQLRVRVLSSRVGDRIGSPKIKNESYVDYEIFATGLNAAAGTLDLGTVALERGAFVSGTIRVENEAENSDLRPPTVYLSRENKSSYLQADKDGKFKSKALDPGSYRVYLSRQDELWELISPRNLDVKEPGQTAVPIEIILKRLKPLVPRIKQARGRIVDEQGVGVAGVAVRAHMTTETGSVYGNTTLITDEKGDFSLYGTENSTGVEVDGAEHPVYVVIGKAQVQIADGIATISGLSARKRGAIFAGRVMGTNGKPAANAWVAVVEARDFAPVQSRADGSFKLVDVPLDKFTLLAARDRDWAQMAVESSAKDVKIALQSAPAVDDRAAAITQLMNIKSGVSTYALFANWDTLGADLTERYIRRNGPPQAAVVAQFGAEMARREPAAFLKRAPELLQATDGEARENLEAQLNLVRAQSDDAGGRTDAGGWLDEQQTVKREINARAVMRLLQMTSVARALGRDDASQWLDYAAAVATQLGGDRERSIYDWSSALSALDYASLAQFAEGWKAPDEFYLWSYVAPVWARAGDLKSARLAMTRMEAMLATPDMAQVTQDARKNHRETPASSLDRTRSAIAGALASSDAPAAFALADQIKEVYPRAKSMLGVADGALQTPGAQNAQVAEKALRDVMQAPTGNIEFFSMAASLGAQISPQLGDELFASALEKSLPDPKGRDGFSAPTIGMWAFYYAPYDAAQSRVLIEQEWNWRLPAAIKSKNDDFAQDINALYDLVQGMAAVDLNRAAQMQQIADAIETKSYGKVAGQFDLAVIALSTPAQRARMGVDERF